MNSSMATGLLALLVIGSAGSTTPAEAATRLISIHAGGKAVTTILTNTDQALRAKAAASDCQDDTVLFAFTEEAIPSPTPVIERTDGGGEVAVQVHLTCSNLDPVNVELVYESQAETPTTGYVVNPSSRVSLSGPDSSGVAGFQVSILGSAAGTDERFSVRLGGGQVAGEWQQTPVFSLIGPEVTPIMQVTLTGLIMSQEPPEGLYGRDEDPYAPDLYRDLYNHCFNQTHENTPECQSITELAAASNLEPLIGVLRTISPEKATALAPTGLQMVNSQMGNVALRVTQLMHGTGGGFSMDGLTLVGNGLPVSLGAFADVLKAADDANEDKRTLLGGTRWGFWLNGTIGSGDYDRRRGNAGFDFDNWSLTSGIDYRINDAFFLGAAAGYSNLRSDFDQGRDRLDARSHALHVYSGYSSSGRLNLDASVSWIRTRYDLQRYLPGPGSHDVTVLDHLTRGRPDSNQISAAIGASWQFQDGIWSLAPTVQYEWIRSRVDAFQEDGSSLFRLRYERQNLSTRSLSGGVYGDLTFATEVGTFRPYGRALWYLDNGTGAYNLLAQFVEGGSPINSVVLTEPDRRYGTIELGFGFRRPIGTRTVDFNFGVMSVVGFEALDRWSLRADLRLPF